MKLNLGCGNLHKPGYVNVDLYTDADRRLDAVTLEGMEAGSTSEIAAEHLLEHLGHQQARAALRRWYELLSPGGQLSVVVPNAPKFAKLWLEAVGDDRRAECLWGQQTHPGEFHKWGYSLGTLMEALREVGFQQISADYSPGINHATREVEPDNCISATAVKP